MTVTVDATAEKVFEFLGDPVNVAACAPNVVRVLDVTRSDARVGDNFRVLYKVGGRMLEGMVTVTRCDLPPRATPHRRYQLHQSFAGAIDGSLVWTMEAQDIQTETSLDVEYRASGGVLPSALKTLLLSASLRKNANRMLENMKVVLEGRPAIASR